MTDNDTRSDNASATGSRATGLSAENILVDILSRMTQGRVLCVGDLMLDRFIYGSVDRISPEAPIPVLRVTREKQMLGGAGNVAANIVALGGAVDLVALIGADGAGHDIEKLMQENMIGGGLIRTNDRATTVKSRFVSNTQQMLRVDREKTEAIGGPAKEAVIGEITKRLQRGTDIGAVILSDYKKGLLTDRVIAETIRAAKEAGVPVIVDPKDKDFSRYRGAAIITPNRKELEAATGMPTGTDDEVRAACMKLIALYDFEAVLATRSQDGMSLIARDAEPLHIPVQVREIYDVSGAGDTVIATFAAAIAAGAKPLQAAQLANIAAGIVVGKAGTATVRREEIEQALLSASPARATGRHHGGKITSAQGAGEEVERRRMRGQTIGFTNGCFDLLHPGHLSTLRQARAACDFLIVGINSDASVARIKGPSRPVQSEAARGEILAALDMVDMVVVFDADTPIDLIRATKPDVLVKGGQYKLEEVVGYDVVSAYGGKVVRAEMEDGFSTTATIARMGS